MIVLHVAQGGTYLEMQKYTTEVIRTLQKKFVSRVRDFRGQISTKKLYRVIGLRMYLPRFGCYLLKDMEVKFDNMIVASRSVNLEWHGSLKPNQKIIVDHIMHLYRPEATAEGRAGGILNLEAGQGKTFVALGLIAKLQRATIVIVHNTSILRQWIKELKQAFPKAKIGSLSGDQKTIGDIQVAVINSLIRPEIALSASKSINARDYFRQFDFVIFDEAHEYCSDSRSQVFTICQRQYMLGLSATPDERLDKLDRIAHWNIGPVIVAKELAGFSSQECKFTAEVTRLKYYGPDEFTRHILNEANDMASIPKIINQIAEDDERTAVVLEQIDYLLGFNHYVFVFADRRSYLEMLGCRLDKRHNQHIYCLLGGASEEEMEKTELNARVILTTYQYMGTGKSIPKMDALVLATPRKSKSKQFIGRIFRLGGNPGVMRRIIDIVDMRTVLKNQWYERRKYYEEHEIEIVELAKGPKVPDLKISKDCHEEDSSYHQIEHVHPKDGPISG